MSNRSKPAKVIKRFGKDVAVYAAADLIARGTQLLALPLYTSLLSVVEFGQLSVLTVTASLLAMLSNLGVNNAVQRFYFKAEADNTKSAVIVTTGLIQLVIVGAILTCLSLAAIYGLSLHQTQMSGIDLRYYALALLFILPDQVTQYTQDIVRLHFKPFRFFCIAIVRTLLGVIVGLVLLVKFKMGLAGVLIGTLVGAALAVPIGLWTIRSDLVMRVERAVSRDLIAYGAHFVVVGASYWIFQSMDRWMLVHYSGMAQVGLFTVANKFAVIVSFATFAFNRAWAPYAFRMHATEPSYRQQIARIFSLWFFALSFLAFGISLFGAEILQLTTPREYWQATPVLSIMCAAMALEGTTPITLLGISFEKRTFLMNYGTWIAAIASVALNVMLLPRFGATGAAISALVAYCVMTGYFLWMSQRLHPLPLEWSKLGYGLFIVALTVVAPQCLTLAEPGIWSLPVKLGLLGLVLAGAMATKVIDFGALRRLAS